MQLARKLTKHVKGEKENIYAMTIIVYKSRKYNQNQKAQKVQKNKK